MKLANALCLTLTAAATLLARPAAAQDVRTVLLRFRKAGDTVVIRNAQVLVDHTIDAVTDSLGIARLPDLEDGGHIVEVVAKGYQAYFDNFVSGATIRMPIDLEILAMVAAAKPKGAPTQLTVSGFAERRALGKGKFFTLAQLKAANGRPLSNFLKVDGSAFMATGPHSESFLAARALSTAASPCYAAVVRDGLRIYPIDGATPPDLDKIFTDDLASVELYPTAAPAALGMPSKCGAVVLWSR